MSCGKKPLVKRWDKSRKIRVITPSRYEQNEASVKQHWKNVVKDLELSYKDDAFWESQGDTVRELVGPNIFHRLAKIFNLPPETKYEPKESDFESLVPSENFYQAKHAYEPKAQSAYSMSNYVMSDEEIDEEAQEEEEQSEQWSVSSEPAASIEAKKSQVKSFIKSRSAVLSNAKSKSFPRFISRTKLDRGSKSKSMKSIVSSSYDESARSEDDLDVNISKPLHRYRPPYEHVKNPHYEMLYCNESETDMIKWNSKYKVKSFEVSASDAFSKKAEILSKQISKEFYDWWVGLGNVEFKSDINGPQDIEVLFQVWFDEHASRGLMLNPKIIPCVLPSIAKYVGVPKTSCPSVLKRQIAYDIHGETSPAHVMAFGTCLPQSMKHIPPNNNTKANWDCVKIPEDLRTMSYVWEDIKHITSVKSFQKWLEQRPHLPMPECLKPVEVPGEKKPLITPVSDYVVTDKASSAQDMALPVSQFSLELKEVLSKLMNE